MGNVHSILRHAPAAAANMLYLICRGHHREVHRCGDEAARWGKIGVDPSAAARVLWLKSYPLIGLPSGDVQAKIPIPPS
jgi:hypothetical protein